MEIRFRLFASLSESAGVSRGSLDLPDGSTVRDLWNALGARFPALSQIGFVPLIACDMEYSDWDRPLHGVDEVAFLPPVSGG